MSNGLMAMWNEIADALKVLAIGGALGAVAKAVLSPEKHWKRRLAQGFAGVISAVTVGQIVAHPLSGLVGNEISALLAAGALCGFAGEKMMSFIQRRFLGDESNDNDFGEKNDNEGEGV